MLNRLLVLLLGFIVIGGNGLTATIPAHEAICFHQDTTAQDMNKRISFYFSVSI